MDIKLIELINELIDELDNSSIIKQINLLKKDIYNDQNLNKLLTKYKTQENSPYTKETIDIKNEIINNETIQKFRTLQYELNNTIIEINKRLTKLTEEKSCILWK